MFTLLENTFYAIMLFRPFSTVAIHHRRSCFLNIAMDRSSRPEVFCKKGVLRNFAKFTGKQLCQSLLFNKLHASARPGVAREKEIYVVQTPRDDLSCSDSSDEEDDELDYCLNDDTQQSIEHETEEKLTESDSDNDCVLATLRPKIKPTSGSSEASDINKEETVTAAKKRKIINQTRWREEKPHYENTKFIGTKDK